MMKMLLSTIFKNLFDGVFHIFLGSYLILQSLIWFLAFVGAILFVLHLSGFLKFHRHLLTIQTEECLNLGGKDVELVDRLPWMKKSETDYDSMMLKLKKSAPRNGRAVYLIRNGLFGPYDSKLEAWN